MAFRKRGSLQISYFALARQSAARQRDDLTKSPGTDNLDKEKWKKQEFKGRKKVGVLGTITKNIRQSSRNIITVRNGRDFNMIEKLPRNLLPFPLGDTAFPTYK